MATNLKDSIQAAMTTALKAQDKSRLHTIRLIWAAIRQQEIDSQSVLDDGETLTLLDKMVKQRRDAIKQYIAADRNDLATQEDNEIAIIQTFMPTPLSDDAIDKHIQQAIQDTAANSMRDMGKVMAQLKPKLQGRADMGIVSQKIKAKLA